MSQDKIYFDPANKQIHLTDNSSHLIWREEGVTPPPPPPSFDDWFLPSQDELAAMRTNLYAESVGNFLDGEYWSSSEYNGIFAWKHRFSTDAQFRTETKAGSLSAVRACRSFTAGVAEYALRDTGPAGGLIFYVDGTTYYEAAPYDQSTGYDSWWCDLDLGATLLGASGTAIGTGATNTSTMVNYPGYGTGDHEVAAKYCVDLVITP